MVSLQIEIKRIQGWPEKLKCKTNLNVVAKEDAASAESPYLIGDLRSDLQ
jgi:hypothetical protein